MPWNKKYGTEEFIAHAFEELGWIVKKNEMGDGYPDLVLILGRKTADQNLIINWRTRFPQTKYVFWSWDPIPELDLIYLSEVVDQTFTSQRCMIDHLENVAILEQACDPRYHHPVDVKKKYKYGFIGTYSPYRERRLKEFDVKIWGRGWKRPDVKEVYNEDFSKAVCQCEIMVNVPISKLYYDTLPYISARKWMIGASLGEPTPTYVDRVKEMLKALSMPIDGKTEGLYEKNKREVQKKL